MGVFVERENAASGKYTLSSESKEIIKDMNLRMNGLTLSDIQVICGGKFRFPVYAGMKEMNDSIEALELSTRGYNSLKRNGIINIADLIDYIDSENDLRKMRNLGVKTAKEIMFSIFLYQYKQLQEGSKDSYMKRLMNMNGIVSLNKIA